jgi:hypothetical protein
VSAERFKRTLTAGLVVASSLVYPAEISDTSNIQSAEFSWNIDNEILFRYLPSLLVDRNLDLNEDNFAVTVKRYQINPNTEIVAIVLAFNKDLGPVNLRFYYEGQSVSLPRSAIEGMRENLPKYGHKPDRETFLEVIENGVVIGSAIKQHDNWISGDPVESIVLARGSNALYYNKSDCDGAHKNLGGGLELYYESCPANQKIDLKPHVRSEQEVNNLFGANFNIWKNAEEYVSSFGS